MGISLKAVAVLATLAALTACGHKSGYDSMNGSGANHRLSSELRNEVGDTIRFGFDRSDITSEADAILKAQADFFRAHPELPVFIGGHCDERGPEVYNFGLGERRAMAASRTLSQYGVDESRITVTSYGKEYPANTGHDEAAWADNRRALTTLDKAPYSNQ